MTILSHVPNFSKRTEENHLTKKLQQQGEFIRGLYIKGILTRKEAKAILKQVWIETIVAEHQYQQRKIREREIQTYY